MGHVGERLAQRRGLPDISSTTSKPSTMPSSRITSPRSRSRGSTAMVAPIRIASSRRYGLARRRPRGAPRHDARRPWPSARSARRRRRGRPRPGPGTTARCGPRCRTGRRSRPLPRRCPPQWCQMLVIGRTTYSANAPSRPTPRPIVLAHRWRRPARQWRHRPHTTWPSPETRSPGWKSSTLRADLDDLADELVSDDERPGIASGAHGIPRLDVQVRAADAGLVDADEDVVDAGRPAWGRLSRLSPGRGWSSRGRASGAPLRRCPCPGSPRRAGSGTATPMLRRCTGRLGSGLERPGSTVPASGRRALWLGVGPLAPGCSRTPGSRRCRRCGAEDAPPDEGRERCRHLVEPRDHRTPAPSVGDAADRAGWNARRTPGSLLARRGRPLARRGPRYSSTSAPCSRLWTQPCGSGTSFRG